MERGAWQATVQGLTNSRTRLSNSAQNSVFSISGLGTEIFASDMVWQKKKKKISSSNSSSGRMEHCKEHRNNSRTSFPFFK